MIPFEFMIFTNSESDASGFSERKFAASLSSSERVTSLPLFLSFLIASFWVTAAPAAFAIFAVS